MEKQKIKFNCSIENEDYVIFDTKGWKLGVDIVNYQNGKKIDLGIVLDKKQTKELIEFLQNGLNDLR